MLKLKYWKTSFPFHYPFTISKGSKTHQDALVIELDHRGIKGYGEAPAIAYYNVTTDAMIATLESKRKFLEAYNLSDPKRFWHFLHHLFPKDPFLVCALDIAGWDISGKMSGKPIFKLLGLNPNQAPQTDYTIGMDSTASMIEKIKSNPAPIYKIKVGGEQDLETLSDIRQTTDAIIRVDANAGWTFEDAQKYLPLLEQWKVELIEQPLPVKEFGNTKVLQTMTSIPIIADEDCVNIHDLESCSSAFKGINIKLTKCSGITPAIELARKAKQLGLEIMLGCMNESVIGTAALAHLSSLADYLDADGPLLLAEKNATGISYENFRLLPSDEPGLGIKPIVL